MRNQNHKNVAHMTEGDPDKLLVRVFQLLVRASERIDPDKRPFNHVVRDTVYPKIVERDSYGRRKETAPFAIVIETDGHAEPGKDGLLEYHPPKTTTITAFSDESLQNVMWVRTLDAVVGEYYPSINEHKAGAGYAPIERMGLAPDASRLYLPTKEGAIIQLDYLDGEILPK